MISGFTFAGVWSVYIKYLCEDVPKEFMGTLQGFLHGVYWGLGMYLGLGSACYFVFYFCCCSFIEFFNHSCISIADEFSQVSEVLFSMWK